MDYYNYGIGNTNGAYGGQFPQYTNPYFQPQQQNSVKGEIKLYGSANERYFL